MSILSMHFCIADRDFFLTWDVLFARTTFKHDLLCYIRISYLELYTVLHQMQFLFCHVFHHKKIHMHCLNVCTVHYKDTKVQGNNLLTASCFPSTQIQSGTSKQILPEGSDIKAQVLALDFSFNSVMPYE